MLSASEVVAHAHQLQQTLQVSGRTEVKEVEFPREGRETEGQRCNERQACVLPASRLAAGSAYCQGGSMKQRGAS